MLDHFNLLAPIYDTFIPPRKPEKLLELLEVNTDQIVLDVGGGTGRISQFLLEFTSKIVIADLSYPMLQQSHAKGDFWPVNSHSEKVPFPANCFDRIVMVDALHHVCDQQETADELWRVLKPGGILVIEEPDLNKVLVKLVALAEKIALMRSHFLTLEEMINLFTDFPAETSGVAADHFVWAVIRKPNQ